jgi:hypothetical protein
MMVRMMDTSIALIVDTATLVAIADPPKIMTPDSAAAITSQFMACSNASASVSVAAGL